MDTFDLLVVFKDGSELIVKDVNNYWIIYEENLLKVEKNGRYQIFNWREVKYCGCLSDLRQQEI